MKRVKIMMALLTRQKRWYRLVTGVVFPARRTRAGALRLKLRAERLEPRQMLHGAMLLGAEPIAEAEGEGQPAPDFALLDVNPTSATYNQTVSPRDYRQTISGWYFGKAG